MNDKTVSIAIVGGIAVGKTTIGKELCNRLTNCRFIEEDVTKNEFLPDFYNDMKKWGFHSRVSTLAMISSNYMIDTSDDRYVLIDRCIDELITFAEMHYDNGNMTSKEYDVYRKLYDCMVSFAPKIDMFVYCYCNTEISLERIRKRSRSFEQAISRSYLDRLNRYYEKWVDSLDKKKIIKVNTGADIDIDKIINNILSVSTT